MLTMHMDTPTTPTDWRTVLNEQGRTIRWLAGKTNRPPRTVYGYSQGTLKAPADWLAEVSLILGVPVIDTLVVTVIREFTDGSAA